MLSHRPPVVVILGHVDHGKTTLLDQIRKSSVAPKEAGGITQHIGAYQVKVNVNSADHLLTFLDTPGHAAFSEMRSRGGKIADIAILVVAATDGVMPQTKEAIHIIQSEKLPVIVAANKVDLPDASLDKLKGQLAENNLIPEDYGGDVPIVPISAKTGQGIPDLLSLIQLINELHPTEADPEGGLEGVVIESRLDRNKGPVVTLIVRNGTLHVGDKFSAGGIDCKVKSLGDENGLSIKAATPGKPVEILGFAGVPPVGSLIGHDLAVTPPQKPTVTNFATVSGSSSKLNLILKTDVVGSLEALQKSLKNEHLEILESSTGDITESDVLKAVSFKARIIGFNVRVPSSVEKLAEIEGVSIKTYRIIYELLGDIEKLILRIIDPNYGEEITGSAKILAIFQIDGDSIAGSKVEKGVLSTGDKVHIKRGEQLLADAKIKSLRKSKDAVTTVKTGDEFGALLSPQIDFKVGDMILSFKEPSL